MRGTRMVVGAGGLAVLAAGLYFGLPRRKEIHVAAHVRINQAGYGVGREQRAYLLAAGPAEGGTFEVLEIATRRVVHQGPVGPSTGSWSATYPHVYALDFGPVTTPGAYEIVVNGSARAQSPQFRIDTHAVLFSSAIADSLFFLRAQRDGAEV